MSRRFSVGIFLLCTLLAFFFLGSSSFAVYNELDFYSRCLKTEGVVRLKEITEDTVTVYVQFIDEKTGKQIMGSYGHQSYPGISRYKIGDKVEILYDPHNPTRSEILIDGANFFEANKLMLGTFFVTGALCTFIALMIARSKFTVFTHMSVCER